MAIVVAALAGAPGAASGGEDLQLVAESPRQLIARVPARAVGPSECVLTERSQTTTAVVRVLGIALAAPKLLLNKGEGTTLTVTVSGLAGLDEIVPLDLENREPAVITMGGGERQRFLIDPSQIEQGTYTIERPLTGIQRGAFTIVGTVPNYYELFVLKPIDPMQTQTRQRLRSQTRADLAVTKDVGSRSGSDLGKTPADQTFGGSAFRQGTALAPMAGAADQSYERRPGGNRGNATDTDNNVRDFELIRPARPQGLTTAPTRVSIQLSQRDESQPR